MEPREDALSPKDYPWRGTSNSPSVRFCQQCHAPLDPVGAEEVAKRKKTASELVEGFVERVLREDPKLADRILREMREKVAELERPPGGKGG